MYRKSPKPIYGTNKRNGPCKAHIDPELDVNTYLHSLNQVLTALEKFNNKQAAMENIHIMETRIQTALGQR